MPRKQVKKFDAAQAAASLLPQDNIPGWTETASGTLLDSYYTPELGIRRKAIEKALMFLAGLIPLLER